MRRNETLLHLADIMKKCNELKLPCKRAVYHYGTCIDEMADDVIAVVNKLLEKPEIRSCRILLVIDFDKMTKADFWMDCKIFSELPPTQSEALKQKFLMLVKSLRALQLKVLQVDSDYAEKLFMRMMTRLNQSTNTLDYELWRARHPHPTMEQLEWQQVQLTANMLINGILAYDEAPTNDEINDVKLELVTRSIKHGQQLPDNFVVECAKLRRYSYWQGDHLFMINYHLIYTYLFSHCFEKFTKKQRITLYEYDVQLKMIHEDMVKLMPELRKLLREKPSASGGLNLFAPAKCLKVMLQREDVKPLFADKRYAPQWIETFVDELFKTKWGQVIAQEWTRADKRLTLQGSFMGCLKAAGMIDGSDMGIARVMLNGNKRENKTFATYMGKWRDQPYFCWIDNYVRGENST